MRILSLLCCFLFAGCASSPEVRRPSSRAKRENPKRVRSVSNIPVSEPKAQPLNSLQEVLKRYESAIGNLGAANAQDIASLKEGLSKFLPQEAKKLSLLSEPDSNNGWFSDVVIAVNSEGAAYFVDKQGKYFKEHLKNRILGGTFTNEAGEKQLLTLFFAESSTHLSYNGYLGTQKIEVLSFEVDREHLGSISTKMRLPSGKLLSLTREGKDNKNIRVNGSLMNPLFL